MPRNFVGGVKQNRLVGGKSSPSDMLGKKSALAKLPVTGSGGDALADAFILAHEAATGLVMQQLQRDACYGLSERLRGIGTTYETNFIADDFLANLWPYCPSNNSNASEDGYKLNFLDPSSYIIAYNNFDPGDFEVEGASGGNGKFANSGYNTAEIDETNFGFIFFKNTIGAAVTSPIGVYCGGSYLIQFLENLGSYFGSTTAVPPVSSTTFDGLFAVRQNENNSQTFSDGILSGDNLKVADTKPADYDFYFHCRNNFGTAALFSSARITTYAFIKKSLTEENATDLYEALGWYNSNVIPGGRL